MGSMAVSILLQLRRCRGLLCIAVQLCLLSSTLHAQIPSVQEPTPLLIETDVGVGSLNRAAEVVSGMPTSSQASEVDSSFACVSRWNWKVLPKGYLYHTYLASSAEPRLSTQIFSNQDDYHYLDSCIGGRLGIVRFGETDVEEGVQLDVLAGAKLRQDLDHEIDMVGTDYRFDIPITFRRGAHALKTGFYHISSHTGDEFLLNHPGFDRLNYYRDAVYLGYSYYARPELRLYAEADYAFSREEAEGWHFQFGFDYAPVFATGHRGAPFLATNVHLREELNYGGNLQVQAGWAWRGEGLGAGLLRTGPFYYDGGSPQFSYYRQNERQVGWGLWYDY